MINQGLIFATRGFVTLITPYVAGTMLLILAVWIGAARSLGKQFTALNAKRDKKAKAASVEATEAPEEKTAKSPQPTA